MSEQKDETVVRDRALVAQVAAAYFENNHVAVGDIPPVISQIAGSLANVGAPAEATVATAGAASQLTKQQIRKSITPEALISFEDGKPYTALRRHLAVRGLTPDQYRQKWGLPSEYPMVAPAYSERRASIAKAQGFGLKGRARKTSAKDTPTAAPPTKTRKAAAAARSPRRNRKKDGAPTAVES